MEDSSEETTPADRPAPPPTEESEEPEEKPAPPEPRVCGNPTCGQLAFEGQATCARCGAPTKKA